MLVLAALGALVAQCGDEPKKLGSACDENTVCDGVCLLGMPGGYCTDICTVLPCPNGSTCEWIAGDNYCLKNCTQSSQCRDGYECVIGVCRPPVAAGEDCEEDEDCESQLCEGGVCSTTCTEQTDCPETLYCDETAGVCVLDDCDATTGLCQRPCEDQTDCAEGTYCTTTATGDRVCKVIPDAPAAGTTGYPCALNDCASGYTCIGLGENIGDPDAYCSETCTADADCPPDMLCREDADGSHYCVRRGLCESCSFDAQCGFENEKCVSADPSVAPDTAYCSTACDPDSNHSCPLDTTCMEAFFCEDSGTWVEDCDQCTGTCGALGAATYQCFHDYGACSGDGELCSPCLHSGQCDTGLCLTGFSSNNRTCSEPCDSHNQCPDNYFCVQVTGQANQCVPRTGSCTEPSGGKDYCDYCNDAGQTDPISACMRGWCLPLGGIPHCLNDCGAGLPDCPAYTTCTTINEYQTSFDVCVPDDATPVDLDGDCSVWATCIAECPTGPASCSANAPSICKQ